MGLGSFVYLVLTHYSYGDIHPTTMGEKWFTIVAMLSGIIVFFGVILGGMASMMTNLDTERATYTHRLNVIKDHLVSILQYTLLFFGVILSSVVWLP